MIASDWKGRLTLWWLLIGSLAIQATDESDQVWQGLTNELGRIEDGGLVWHDLMVEVGSHGENATRLLETTSGILRNGELTALIGPSGSGKTTLLTSLAGLTVTTSGFVAQFRQSNDRVILQPISPQRIGYLRQQDDFFTQLTVQETLQLAAFLELPSLSHSDRQTKITQTVQQLGLANALNRQIGDPSQQPSVPRRSKKRSFFSFVQRTSSNRLSGGERRRLSVALEILTSKQLLLADEPTSGLDSAYAATVVNLLQDLAVTRHIPVICSIHQPRSSIWKRLDSVILMAPGGHVCYAGPRSNAVPYFEKLGYKLPVDTNPAEFLVDLMSMDAEDVVQAEEDAERIRQLAVAFREYQQERGAVKADSSITVEVADPSPWDTHLWKRRSGSWKSLFRWIPRLAALVRRTWRQNVRDQLVNVVRAVLSVTNALLMAGMFPTIRGIPMVNSVADRVALLTFAAIQMCMLSYMKAVTLFAKERRVVEKEQYSVAEYLLSKLVAEVPLDSLFALLFAAVLKQSTGLQIGLGRLSIVFSLTTIAGATLGYGLGSFSPNNEVYATLAGIPVLVVFMIVGVINPSGRDASFSPPRFVQYIKEISPIAYAIEALCLGEYTGVEYQPGSSLWSRLRQTPKMGGLSLVKNGDQVLKALGLQDQTFRATTQRLAFISIGNIALSWVGLMWHKHKQRRWKRGEKTIVVPTSSVQKANFQPIRVPVARPGF